MVKPLIVANWKANKTVTEALDWLRQLENRVKIKKPDFKKVKVVVCPPFTALEPMRSEIKDWGLEVSLGAQNVSPFGDGPYTGEISARMLAGLVDYVLIGHSEREKNFSENIRTAGLKIKMAQSAGITPILCVGDLQEIPKETGGNPYLLYEPPKAISRQGVFRPESPENVQKVIAQWKPKLGKIDQFLYGGSVNSTNITQFLTQPDIDGVVVGHASLDLNSFWELISHVLS